jgi:transcriptional regulator GlxA family with amidase domain
MKDMTDLRIAIVLYENMTTLDAVGPMEVLRFLPGARIELVAEAAGPVLTDTGVLALTATAGFDDVDSADVVVVPGGPGTADVLDGALVAWLRRVHPTTRWTTSVCSGSLVLAAAGLLGDGKATSHFAVVDLLPMWGVQPTHERVVVDAERRIITAAGVSSGIDMALTLAEILTDTVAAQAIQLVIEYDPQPPFDTGSPASASQEVMLRAIELGRPHGAIPESWQPAAAPR